ncbi:contactin-4-like isoform X1 [Paramuricea clavata]|uniref:Contactin-4-like isoform X1 n=1 Tax=Paramuricea clavata TaxID=317549 RepID=A0A7D9DQA7_PARCT|nr:contactin-4-like isoform X1 [Paramuricea clavata]
MKSMFLALLGTILLGIIDHGNSEPYFAQEPGDFTGFQRTFRDQLSSVVRGAVNPTYQWFHNGSTMNQKTAIGTTNTRVMFFQTSLASQGIYQLIVSSKMGRIFGREIKVEFIVLGQFLDKTKTTHNVVIGQQLQIECPAHSFTKHAVYKWGGTGSVTGTWFLNGRANVLVLGDGRLFFSHVTKDVVDFIEQQGGISCLLEVTDKVDVRFEQSGVFELNVTGDETKSFGPNMEKVPDEEVVEGSSMLLRCIAAGYPTPTYRWKKTDLLGVTSNVFDKVNGVLLSETNKVLYIKKIEKNRHAGTYTCHATIDDGGAQKTAKESSTVTIREKPNWVKGTLITSGTPNISTSHSWKCMARGDPEPEYNWYANTTIMNNVSGRHTIEGGILTIYSVSPEDDGMYQCVAKNKFGFAYQTVSLQVKVKPPEITRALFQENFVAGNTGLISCVSDALPSADHHWLFNGAKLETNKTGKYGLTPRQDLLVHQLSQNDTGTYTCVATNTYGRTTKEKHIKVAEIMFKRRPENNTNVIQGTSFSLFCEADSDPPLNIAYRWLFEGKALQKSDFNYQWDLSTHTLAVSDAQGHESGVYECIAYSPTSQKSSSATVIVRALPYPPQKLTLHGKCTDLTANLTWVIGHRNAYEPLTRILIQWSASRDTSTWYNFSDHVAGSADGHVVKGLNPYSDIVFRVIAANQHGMGKPSNVTAGQECKTPAAKPAICPANVQGNSTHPHDINVTWQDVEPLRQNGPGFGYIVRYKKQSSASWNEKTIPYGNEPMFTIANTSASELWDVQIQSYNDEGTGPQCPVVQAQSGKEAEIMFRIRPENKTNVQKGSNFSLHCEAHSKPRLSINYKWLHEGKELSETGMTYTVSKSRLQDSGKYECVAYVKTSIYNVEKRSASTVFVRGPPDAPRDLTLNGKCSENSANLTWTISRHSYQPLTNITIQWAISGDTSTWYDVTDHVAGSANGHVVRGLNPYSDIVFRVTVVNKYGQSAPSDSTSGQECKTAQAKPTVCPTDVEGSADVPHTIVISWKAVPQLYQNGPDFAYNVSYGKPGTEWQHKVVQGRESYTISNAGADQLWEFKVKSKNAQGNGPECQTQQARTARVAPKSAPQSLEYKEIGADYVILQWTQVDASGIEGYQLSYWYKNTTETRVRRAASTCNAENNPCTTRIQNPATRNYTQQNLKPFKEYTMFLQANNSVGLGPKSDPLTLTTKEGRPGPPEHLKVTRYGRYLNMTWKPPAETNGVITGYVLSITNGTNITVDGNTRAYLFKDLEPLTAYGVSINARTSAGVGNTVSKTVITTEIRAPAVAEPPFVHGVDEDSVNVTYNASTHEGGFPEKFYIVYKEKGVLEYPGVNSISISSSVHLHRKILRNCKRISMDRAI